MAWPVESDVEPAGEDEELVLARERALQQRLAANGRATFEDCQRGLRGFDGAVFQTHGRSVIFLVQICPFKPVAYRRN